MPFNFFLAIFSGAARIRPSTQGGYQCGFHPLDQELQEIVRDAALGKQRVDKLFQVTRRDGEPLNVLLHFEVQAHPEPELPCRAYEYHHRT